MKARPPYRARRLSTGARTGLHAMAILACSCVAAPAAAQKWFAEAGVDSRLDATTNSNLGEASGTSDLTLSVKPELRLRAETLRLKAAGTIGLIATVIGRTEQPSRLVPSGDISARLEAIERLLFLEAGYRATQTGVDPFGARADATTSSNTFTTSQFRFSPSIERELSPELHLRARSDNSWTNAVGSTEQVGVANASGYFARHAASIERDPRPLGWRLDIERSRTRYRDPTMDSFDFDIARAHVNYLLVEELSVGLRAGRERNNLGGVASASRTIYGAETAWRPSARTTLTAFAEQRFFGKSWDLAFAHRQPQFAWEIGAARTVTSTPQSLFDLPATQNVAALLDSMLTTRIADPIARAGAVQELIASRGLPSATQQATTLFLERLSLVNSVRATVTMIGLRNTVTAGFSAGRTSDLPGVTLSDTGSLRANTRQYGANVIATHQLSPLMSLKAGFDWSRIRGLGVNAVESTSESALSVQVDLRSGAKSNMYFGALFRSLNSSVVTTGQEVRLFAGLNQRF